MSPNSKNPDITIRGGLINIPNSSKPQHPPRHQPNTPPNKKKVTPRVDYQIPKTDPPTTTKKPKTAGPAPPEPAADKPDGDKNHVPAEVSESD